MVYNLIIYYQILTNHPIMAEKNANQPPQSIEIPNFLSAALNIANQVGKPENKSSMDDVLNKLFNSLLDSTKPASSTAAASTAAAPAATSQTAKPSFDDAVNNFLNSVLAATKAPTSVAPATAPAAAAGQPPATSQLAKPSLDDALGKLFSVFDAAGQSSASANVPISESTKFVVRLPAGRSCYRVRSDNRGKECFQLAQPLDVVLEDNFEICAKDYANNEVYVVNKFTDDVTETYGNMNLMHVYSLQVILPAGTEIIRYQEAFKTTHDMEFHFDECPINIPAKTKLQIEKSHLVLNTDSEWKIKRGFGKIITK